MSINRTLAIRDASLNQRHKDTINRDKLNYTDHWGAYTRHLEPEIHSPGKRNTQKIERKHLTLRTRIKRLTRKTICFSKSVQMHDIVIGLFVNRYAFGRAV